MSSLCILFISAIFPGLLMAASDTCTGDSSDSCASSFTPDADVDEMSLLQDRLQLKKQKMKTAEASHQQLKKQKMKTSEASHHQLKKQKMKTAEASHLQTPVGCLVGQLSTPNDNTYYLIGELPEADYLDWTMTLQVEAPNDAHIGISSDDSFPAGDGKMYELVVGGWGNYKSVIREKKQGTNLATVDGLALGGAGANTSVTISKMGSVLQITTDKLPDPLTYSSYGNITNAKYIGLMTGWGATGNWANVCYTTSLPPTTTHTTTTTAPDACFINQLSTPNDYTYYLVGELADADSDFTITLNVKASNDAHIAISNDDGFPSGDGKLYEVAIGGWGNQKSVIREKKQGANLATVDSVALGGADTFTSVTVSRVGPMLQITTDKMSDPLIYEAYGNITNAKYIGLMTGWGATGEWNNVCPAMVEGAVTGFGDYSYSDSDDFGGDSYYSYSGGGEGP